MSRGQGAGVGYAGSGSESTMSLTSVPFVRADHRTRKSHAKAHPAAAEAFLGIAGSASVRVAARLKREAGDDSPFRRVDALRPAASAFGSCRTCGKARVTGSGSMMCKAEFHAVESEDRE